MFEEIKKNNNLNNPEGEMPKAPSASPAASGAGKVEDIFADTEKGPTAQSVPGSRVFQTKESSVNSSMSAEGGGDKKDKIKKMIIAATSVLGLIIIIFGGGWYVYGKFFSAANIPADENSQAPDNLEEEPIANDEFLNTDNIEEEKSDEFMENISDEIIEENPIGFSKKKDSDQDGLVDEDEIKLGTNINSPDSDGDGLFDREEVVVYKTDPLNPDTDGDGYLDGAEVRAGYNPKGAGKLYEVNRN